jgi:putative membrane protein
MFWWWGGGAWWIGLVNAAVIVGILVAAVLLLRQELPDLQHRFGEPPALRTLEERYARGEISREEFLERRRVLLEAHPPPPTAPGQGTGPGGSDPTAPIPPMPQE